MVTATGWFMIQTVTTLMIELIRVQIPDAGTKPYLSYFDHLNHKPLILQLLL